MSNDLQLLCRAEIARLQQSERSLTEDALKSLREYRKGRIANRQLPCQPKAAA